MMRHILRPFVIAAEALSRTTRMRIWSLRLASVGASTIIYPRAAIYSPRQVRLGSHVNINDFVHIRGLGGVEIGDHTLIAPGVIITSQSHDVTALERSLLYRETNTRAPVRIGRNVWIGAGATVLPGVTIGDDSIIAAGAVVREDIPPRSLVAGVPGKVIRTLEAPRNWPVI